VTLISWQGKFNFFMPGYVYLDFVSCSGELRSPDRRKIYSPAFSRRHIHLYTSTLWFLTSVNKNICCFFLVLDPNNFSNLHCVLLNKELTAFLGFIL